MEELNIDSWEVEELLIQRETYQRFTSKENDPSGSYMRKMTR